MPSESFVLQKLEHRRIKRLRYTVYLIKKKYALRHAAFLYGIVHGCDDLTHRIFRNAHRLAAVFLFIDKRKPERRLSRMVGHGIAHKRDAQFRCDLFHDRRLSYTGRTQKKDRTLPYHRYAVISVLILLKIEFNGIFYVFFCFFYVHNDLSSTTHPVAHEGALGLNSSSSA